MPSSHEKLSPRPPAAGSASASTLGATSMAVTTVTAAPGVLASSGAPTAGIAAVEVS